jgi:hypothetical protein
MMAQPNKTSMQEKESGASGSPRTLPLFRHCAFVHALRLQ